MNISIVLDRLTPYTPGETVKGRVLFIKSSEHTLGKPLGLKIQFKGEASVRFTINFDYHVKGGWKTYNSNQIYFNSTKYLIGNGKSEVGLLQSHGLQEYPFSYKLPGSLPSSYKGSHGSVDYTVTITLKRSWGVHKQVTLPFNVNADLDICQHNFRQDSELSLRRTEKIGILWWGGTLLVNFKLFKKSFIPGESINFNAQIINDTNYNIHKPKILIIQECRYYAEGRVHKITHIIKKIKGPPMKLTINWENSIKIPQIPPTNLGAICNIIQINYFVTLEVSPKTMSLKAPIVCKIPVVIGTLRGSHRLSTNSLTLGNRVGHTFGSHTTTLDSYYQNVVFPLSRCFSAPVYENYRFSTNTLQPDDDNYEPPPTYDEAMELMNECNSDLYENQPVYNN